MSTELQEKLAYIKAECRHAGETYAAGFGQALLLAIEYHEDIYDCEKDERWVHGRPSPAMKSLSALQRIAAQFQTL